MKQSSSIRKIVSDKGALMLLHLKQRNEELEAELLSKDINIRKLQGELKLSKVYAKDHILYKGSFSRNSNRLESQSSKVTGYDKYFNTPSPLFSIKSPEHTELQCYMMPEQYRLTQNLMKIKEGFSFYYFLS